MGSSWIRDWTMSPTLAGGFFTTGPVRKSPITFLKWHFCYSCALISFFGGKPLGHSLLLYFCPTCVKLLIMYPTKSYKHHRTYPFLHVICIWWHFAIYAFILFWNSLKCVRKHHLEKRRLAELFIFLAYCSCPQILLNYYPLGFYVNILNWLITHLESTSRLW